MTARTPVALALGRAAPSMVAVAIRSAPGLPASLAAIPHRSDVVRRPRSARSPAGAAFPYDATAVKHTLASLGAKLEVLMRSGETGQSQDQRVVQRAGSHMRGAAFGSDEVKESSHVTRAYPIRFPLHALVCF